MERRTQMQPKFQFSVEEEDEYKPRVRSHGHDGFLGYKSVANLSPLILLLCNFTFIFWKNREKFLLHCMLSNIRYYCRSYKILKKSIFPFPYSFFPPIPVGFVFVSFFSSAHLFWISSYALFKCLNSTFQTILITENYFLLHFYHPQVKVCGFGYIYNDYWLQGWVLFLGCYLALNKMDIDILAVWCQGHFNQLLFVSLVSLALAPLFWSYLKSAYSGPKFVLCCGILCFWFIIYH